MECNRIVPTDFFKILFKNSACSITMSNTTCYCNLTSLFIVYIYICPLERIIFKGLLSLRI